MISKQNESRFFNQAQLTYSPIKLRPKTYYRSQANKEQVNEFNTLINRLLHEYIVNKITAKPSYILQAKRHNGFTSDSINTRT